MTFLKSTTARILFAVLLGMVALAPAVSAAPTTSTFQILLDLDNHQNTGCDVPALTGTFKGVEQILITTVTAGGPVTQVTAVQVRNCVSGTTFGPPAAVPAPAGHPLPWNIGVGNGTGGTEVIETYLPLSMVTVNPLHVVQVGVLAFDSGNVLRDELLTKQPQGNAPILLNAALALTDIPTLSEWGLIFLGLMLAGTAMAVLRRRRTVASVVFALLLLGSAGLAWAVVTCDLDGNTTTEWTSSVNNPLLATDAVPDTPVAPVGTDIRALFGAKDDTLNALVFRIDADLPAPVFNQSPTANNDTATVTEDSGANAITVLANDSDPESDPLSIQSVTQPAHGTVAITGGGTGLTYTPNANYCNNPPGTTLDTFTYTLAPGGPGTTGTVTVTVNCVDDNPLAVNDSATVTEDSGPTAVNVLANDTDVDGGAKSITSVTQPANGTVVITGGGTGLTYQPNANYCNTPPGTFDTFTYTLTPGGSTATVSVAVTCGDDAPTAVNDAATVAEDSSANPIDVLANDTDVDGGTKLVASVTQPANGTVAITGGGTGVTYTPNANYCNTPPGTTLDTFTYSLTPGGSTATVAVTVTCDDDNPVAVADAATVAEDSSANPIDVLANDTDPDGGTKSVTSVTQPANGTVVITGGGTGVSYTPNANYCNSVSGPLDTFTYTLTPGGSTATVSVTVTCVDDNPVAVNDSATVAESSGANPIDVLANDTDVDGGPKSVTSVTQPANGTVVITGGGTGVSYTPNVGYCNSSGTPDTFTYTLTPGGSTATVSVTVTCVDDPPMANSDSATVTEDSGTTAIDVLANDTDPDGGTKLINSATQPANGTVAITGGGTGVSYTPNANYCNTPPGTTLDTFTYTLIPGGSTATVTVTVTCVDDAPVIDLDADDNKGTTGSDFATTFTEGSPGVLIEDPTDATLTDVDSPTLASLTVTITNLLDPGSEILSTDLTGTSITGNYVPATGTLTLTGPDTVANFQTVLQKIQYQNTDVDPDTTPRVIHFVANDGTSNSNTATSTVTIVATDTPPTAVNDSITVAEDSGATPIDALANDTDPDNGPKSITSVTQPANGTVVITGGGTGLTYTPNANYCNNPSGSPDTFTYTLTPGGSTATVSVTVTCADDNPVSVADTATVTEDSGATSIPVLANDTDPDGGPESITSVTQPANGTVVITGGGTGLTYAPNANYCNNPPGTTPDTFTYTLTPGGSTATVTVTVTCVDDNPVAVADLATVVEDAPATAIDVLANDTDVDGGPKSVASVTQPANGTVVITGGGTGLTYQPNPNYCNNPSGSPDTFTYTLNPGGSSTTVSVTVTCVDDPPVAVADSATVLEDSGTTSIAVLTNDTDVDGGPKSIASVTQPANGVVVITGGGTGLTYAPNANYCNNPPGTTPDTFTYTLTPGSSSTTVSVTVTCVNDAPVLANPTITYSTPGNTQLHVAGATRPGVASVSDAQGILAKSNPSDIDGPGPLQVIPVASGTSANGGSYTLSADGTFTYVPAAGFTGTDTFTFQVTDNGSPAATATGTVSITVGQRVWYIRDVVDANNAAGGDGRSTNAFDSIAAFNAATTNNGDIIFIFRGNTGTTPLAGGIVLKDGQKLWGEGIGLTVSGFGTLVPAGAKPRINNTGGDAVSVPATAGSRQNVEIRGLDLQASGNAVDVTASGANNVSVTISDNNVTGAGLEGYDLNAGSTGTFAATLNNNAIGATGNAFDARTSAATTMTIDFSNNSVVSNATGILIDGSGGGTTTITGFTNNAVSQNNVGTGIAITSAKFDATPTGSYQTVSGGTTVVGASGNGVGASGVVMTGVSGALAFTDLDIFADGGAALRITGTGVVNTGAGTGTQVTVGAGVAIFEATGGPAVDVTNATIDLQPTSIKSTNSASTGVSLDTVTGTFAAGSGSSITNATGTDFNINAGNAAVTYNGTITDTTGRLVSVTSTTGGTKSFTGAISDTNSGTGQGIFLNGNTGATINFSAALTLSTGNTDAFTATGGGTVTATDTTSTLTTTTGVALNVANTTIGAGGLKFRSISAGTAGSGPTNGIVLNNTGASGGLTVSGTGSAGSGGTIRKAGTGISLTSTRNVSLSYLQLNDFTDYAIRGASVVNFSMANTVINGVNGNDPAANEGSVRFTELTGTASISNSNISGSVEDTFSVVNTTGSLNRITFTNDTFGVNATTTGDNGLLLEAQASAVLNATIQNSFFTSARGDLVQATITSGATGSMDVVFTGNTLSDNHPAIVAGGGGTLFGGVGGTFTYNIASNTFRDATGDALVVSCGGVGSSCVGRIENNQIGLAGTANSGSTGGSGIALVSAAGGTFTSLVNNNTVRQYNNTGIRVQAGDQMGNPLSFNATVTNNTVGNPGSINTNFNGIQLNNGTVSTDNFTSCFDLRGNSITASGSGAVAPNNADFRLRQRQSTTVRLPGYGGANNNDAAVVAFLSGNNTATTGASSNTVPTGGGYVGGAACPTPP